MEVKNTSYGDKFITIRTTLQLKQSDFAEKLGIGQSYYSAIENGKKQPSLNIINKLWALGVSIKWFYNGVGDIIVPIFENATGTEEKSELIERNYDCLNRFYSGNKIEPYNYEYLQIKYFEQFSIKRIDELINLALTEVERLYNTGGELREVIHFFGGPQFLLEKFTLLNNPFMLWIKYENNEFEEIINESNIQDIKLEKILWLMNLHNRKEDIEQQIVRISYYMNRYKDEIKEAIKGSC